MSFLPKSWTKYGEIYRNAEHTIYICTVCHDSAKEFDHNFVFYDVISLLHHIEYKHEDGVTKKDALEEYMKKNKLGEGGMENSTITNSNLRKTNMEEISGNKVNVLTKEDRKRHIMNEKDKENSSEIPNKKLIIQKALLDNYDDEIKKMLLLESDKALKIPQYICPYCKEQFLTNLEFLLHLNEHKTDAKDDNPPATDIVNPLRPYKCMQCFQDFSAPWQLKRHQTIHKRPEPTLNKSALSRPFQCGQCGKRTSSEKSSVLHERRFHSKTEALETTKCKVCSKLILEVNMRQHLLVHSSTRSYKCELCDRTYRQRQSLTWHIKTKHSKVFEMEKDELDDDDGLQKDENDNFIDMMKFLHNKAKENMKNLKADEANQSELDKEDYDSDD